MKISFDPLLAMPDSKMETLVFKYRIYDLIKNKDGDYMIVGYNQVPIKNYEPIEIGERTSVNSPMLLYAFIELYAKLGIKGGFRSAIETQIENNLELIKPVIINFCQEYGLPYCGNIAEQDIQYNNFSYELTNLFDHNTLDKLRGNDNGIAIAYCNLSYFLYWLKILYRDFLWYITMTDQTDIIENFEINMKINMSAFKKARLKKKEFSPDITNHFSYNSRLQKVNNGFQFRISTSNIFHLATYYFCLICVGGISINKTLIIKPKCKLCGMPFIAERKQTRYCDQCSPQKAWNAKHR